MEHRISRQILVHGVVQGVGFRPFVYRIATSERLGGSVCNLGDAGVEILVEGAPAAVDRLLHALKYRLPPLAIVTSIEVEERPLTAAIGFQIIASRGSAGSGGTLPPDVSICDACIEDLRGATRYAGYWATSCTDCGPRFTVIEGLPYDRPYTSMADFPMCEACRREYAEPLDRRYHAQTIACPTCGPRLAFDGGADEPLRQAVEALLRGEIVAIKGLGGTHLACDATSCAAVQALRTRLGRPGQPFAMMATEAWSDRLAWIDPDERTALRSPQRPIVVLRKRPGALPSEVAPGLHTVGIMLPYTGLHVMLLDRIDRPLVMTSANRPGAPMMIENREIETRLRSIADHRLTHDRRIVARCDDSVVRRSGGGLVLLRRSRGHVPQPISVRAGERRILATGPESDLTFALYAEGQAALSQHIGTVDDLETYEYYVSAIRHLEAITGFTDPEVLACDLHPRFMTTQWAEETAAKRGIEIVRVQHHVAHLASVMAEHGVDRAVGLVLDGYGYGVDGHAWGGEVFSADEGRVERVGSLAPVRMPGGDQAARRPMRMAASYLLAAGWGADEVNAALSERGVDEAETLVASIARGVNAPLTSSAGRFLDAVAAWLGVCRDRTYEGEPAMRLEAAAAGGDAVDLKVPFTRDAGVARFDAIGLFAQLVELSRREDVHVVAATAQQALATGMADLAIIAAEAGGFETVALSGGVAYNDAISARIRASVEDAGLRFIGHRLVPCGDGGISLGQVSAAGLGWRLADE